MSENKTIQHNLIANTSNLRSHLYFDYPPHNVQVFEEFFYERFVRENLDLERIYIPIFWTEFYVVNNYGTGDNSPIQRIIDSLDPSKKYFTIVQNDGNIHNDLGNLDVKIFNMSSKGQYEDRCYTIPCVCLPPTHLDLVKEKDIFASFIGRKNTNPMRNQLIEMLEKDKRYFVTDFIHYDVFRDVMARSTFSLCPRGCGPTSFRVCEALQSGSIPVIINDDEEYIPFKGFMNIDDFAISIHSDDMGKIDEILSSVSEEQIARYVENGKKYYQDFYTYDGCFDRIIEVLKKESL